MLIRMTNHCTMGCSHCMIDASGPKGVHMTEETFEEALELRKRLGSRIIVLSGGEPTDHPQFFELARKALKTIQDYACVFIVASNGLFALDERKFERMCRLVDDHHGYLMVQVTNDIKYYPRNLMLIRHKFERPHWTFVDNLLQLTPCRRTRENNRAVSRQSPSCFNIHANTRLNGLASALAGLEGLMRACCPSVNVDGTVRAGEMDTCAQVGTVADDLESIEEKLVMLQCGACGLRDNLPEDVRAMIGEE